MADDPSLVSLYSFDSSNIPQNIQIYPTDNVSSLKLSWNPVNVVLFSGYKISQAYTNDLEYQEVGRTTDNKYIVSGLDPRKQYFFTIQTIEYDSNSLVSPGAVLGSMILGNNRLGDSFFLISGYYNDIYPNYAPQNLKTTFSGLNNYVSWDQVINTGISVSGYRVWRSDSWDGQLNSIGSTKNTTYIDSGLNSQMYYYRVSTLF